MFSKKVIFTIICLTLNFLYLEAQVTNCTNPKIVFSEDFTFSSNQLHKPEDSFQ